MVAFPGSAKVVPSALSGSWAADVPATLQLGCWGLLELCLQPTKRVVGLAAKRGDLLSEEQQKVDETRSQAPSVGDGRE